MSEEKSFYLYVQVRLLEKNIIPVTRQAVPIRKKSVAAKMITYFLKLPLITVRTKVRKS